MLEITLSLAFARLQGHLLVTFRNAELSFPSELAVLDRGQASEEGDRGLEVSPLFGHAGLLQDGIVHERALGKLVLQSAGSSRRRLRNFPWQNKSSTNRREDSSRIRPFSLRADLAVSSPTAMASLYLDFALSANPNSL